jgi:hypothetical protein
VSPKVAVAFVSVVLGVFGALAGAWVFVSLARAEYLSAVVALGAAVFSFGMIAMLTIVASRKVAPRVTRDDSGIVVRPDRRVDALLLTSTFAGFFAMALYAIFAPLGVLNISAPRGNSQYIVFICAAGALGGVFSLRQIVKQRGTSCLWMSQDGLVTGNTMTTAQRSWDEVTAIGDRPRNARRSSGATYITTADGRSRVVPSDWYTPGGHGLREFVRFYWQHPEARAELADGRAAQRLEAQSGGAT